jgi:transcription antitermination factor NusG
VPILKAEPSIFPENLLEDLQTAVTDRQWWVFYTKARQEKSLSRELFTWQIPFYLPLVKNVLVSKGRRRTSFVPLFSGYIFLFASETERVRSLTTNRVSKTLTVDDSEQLIRDLCQLQRLIASDVPLNLESRLESGNRVRVKQGPLMGIEGTVLTRRGLSRLLVSINFLQQGASVEVEDCLLEKID